MDTNKEIYKQRRRGFDIQYPIVEEMRKNFFDKSISSEVKKLDKNIGRFIIPITLCLKEDNLKLINDILLMNEKRIIFDYLKSKDLLVEENNGKSGFTMHSPDEKLMYLPYLALGESYYLKEDIMFFSKITLIEYGEIELGNWDDIPQLNLVLEIDV